MAEPIVVIDTSEIRKGKRPALERAIRELVEFVDRNETRILAYRIFLDADRMTVLQVHPDSASAEFHMQVAAPVFRQFRDLLQLETMELYGHPSDELVTMLRAKAELLGGTGPIVHEPHAGFVRLASLGEEAASASATP